MYITDPKDTIIPSFRNKCDSQARGFEGLSDANSHYTYFDAIQEEDDPLVMRQSTRSKPLTSSDYLIESPFQDRYLLSQSRLTTLKAQIDQLSLKQKQESLIEQKRATFLSGLLGN